MVLTGECPLQVLHLSVLLYLQVYPEQHLLLCSLGILGDLLLVLMDCQVVLPLVPIPTLLLQNATVLDLDQVVLEGCTSCQLWMSCLCLVFLCTSA